VKKTLLGVAAAIIGIGMPAMAMAEEAESWIPGTFTANVALTSDYVFRGLSQSNNRAAIQGGFDWDTGGGFTDSGTFHFGLWASSLNFKDGGEGQTEIDIYGGYGGKIGEKTTYDIGFIYYYYPGARRALNYDLWEVYGKAGYDFGPAAVSFGVNYSPDNFGGTGDALYLNGGVSVPVTEKLAVSAAVGYYSLEAPIKDYTDWNIGAKLNVNDWFNVDVRYYDTDIVTRCPNAIGRRTCGPKGVITISRSF
jgi:uncharacterized protein (TIGR02001 family)